MLRAKLALGAPKELEALPTTFQGVRDCTAKKRSRTLQICRIPVIFFLIRIADNPPRGLPGVNNVIEKTVSYAHNQVWRGTKRKAKNHV